MFAFIDVREFHNREKLFQVNRNPFKNKAALIFCSSLHSAGPWEQDLNLLVSGKKTIDVSVSTPVMKLRQENMGEELQQSFNPSFRVALYGIDGILNNRSNNLL